MTAYQVLIKGVTVAKGWLLLSEPNVLPLGGQVDALMEAKEERKSEEGKEEGVPQPFNHGGSGSASRLQEGNASLPLQPLSLSGRSLPLARPSSPLQPANEALDQRHRQQGRRPSLPHIDPEFDFDDDEDLIAMVSAVEQSTAGNAAQPSPAGSSPAAPLQSSSRPSAASRASASVPLQPSLNVSAPVASSSSHSPRPSPAPSSSGATAPSSSSFAASSSSSRFRASPERAQVRHVEEEALSPTEKPSSVGARLASVQPSLRKAPYVYLSQVLDAGFEWPSDAVDGIPKSVGSGVKVKVWVTHSQRLVSSFAF